MNRKILGILTVVACAETVHAQSSVTLYGIVDAGLLYSNNISGQKSYSMTSGNLQGSRWGLKGSEDLGGGLKAIFVLENGFTNTNGKLAQGGDEFGRQAFVGLSSQRFGTVTLGRQYDSVFDYVGQFASGQEITGLIGMHPGELDNMKGSNRVNNSVKFKSSNYGGLTFGGLYSLGGVAGQFNRNQIWSLGLGYGRGPLKLGAAYLNVKDPNYSFFGNNSSSSTSASNMTGSLVYSGYASAKTLQVTAAGGSYTFGPATVGATYSNTQFKDLGSESGLAAVGLGGTAKFHNAEANVTYKVTPALVLGAAYDYTMGYGVNDARYHQVNLGGDYFLSKRTDLYLVGIYQHASGTDSTGKAARADINSLSPSSTANQLAALIGIRHKF